MTSITALNKYSETLQTTGCFVHRNLISVDDVARVKQRLRYLADPHSDDSWFLSIHRGKARERSHLDQFLKSMNNHQILQSKAI